MKMIIIMIVMMMVMLLALLASLQQLQFIHAPSVDKLGDAHHKALNVAKWQMVDMECCLPHCLCRPSNCLIELGRIEQKDGRWKMNAKRAADSDLSSFYNISNRNSKNYKYRLGVKPATSRTPLAISIIIIIFQKENGKQKVTLGLGRELNPRPLAPAARIIPLDQRDVLICNTEITIALLRVYVCVWANFNCS